MAKKSMVARDLKRQKMIEKYAAKRAELKAAGDLEGLQLRELARDDAGGRAGERLQPIGRGDVHHSELRAF